MLRPDPQRGCSHKMFSRSEILAAPMLNQHFAAIPRVRFKASLPQIMRFSRKPFWSLRMLTFSGFVKWEMGLSGQDFFQRRGNFNFISSEQDCSIEKIVILLLLKDDFLALSSIFNFYSKELFKLDLIRRITFAKFSTTYYDKLSRSRFLA